jgi:hypothetical protein
MKLSDLAKKPQLVKVIIEDEDIVKEFGEPLEFYTWDRQPMNTFLKLASVDQTNTASIFDAVRELVLNEDGTPVLSGEVSLPTMVMMRVITRVVEGLGKL